MIVNRKRYTFILSSVIISPFKKIFIYNRLSNNSRIFIQNISLLLIRKQLMRRNTLTLSIVKNNSFDLIDNRSILIKIDNFDYLVNNLQSILKNYCRILIVQIDLSNRKKQLLRNTQNIEKKSKLSSVESKIFIKSKVKYSISSTISNFF